jgi:hypothetical protein
METKEVVHKNEQPLKILLQKIKPGIVGKFTYRVRILLRFYRNSDQQTQP